MCALSKREDPKLKLLEVSGNMAAAHIKGLADIEDLQKIVHVWLF
jgi:hypothetical protein